MVTFNREHLIGKAYEQKNGKELEIKIYKGNCFAVLIYEYKKDGETWEQLYGFFADEKHLKRCKDLFHFSRIELKANYQESYILAKELTKENTKTTIYYF